MPLPNSRTSVSKTMEELYWLVYGPPGIGKSTFAAGFPEAIFLTTENAHRHLQIYNRPIKDWADCKMARMELKTQDGKRFKNIVFDTVDLLYKFCLEFICKRMGISHPQDEKYGKGYDAVNTEFLREIVMYSQLSKGLFFISHSKDKEVTSRNMTYTKTIPSLSGGCHTILVPFVDEECYLGFSQKDGQQRVAIFEPREVLEAKDRFGRFPKEVSLPKGRTYEAIKAAWEAGTGLSTGPKKLK